MELLLIFQYKPIQIHYYILIVSDSQQYPTGEPFFAHVYAPNRQAASYFYEVTFKKFHILFHFLTTLLDTISMCILIFQVGEENLSRKHADNQR